MPQVFLVDRMHFLITSERQVLFFMEKVREKRSNAGGRKPWKLLWNEKYLSSLSNILFSLQKCESWSCSRINYLTPISVGAFHSISLILQN